jgi:hypothetical protein
MTRARLDGLYFLLLGCAVFISLGSVLENVFPLPMVDFRTMYYSARCLVRHCDPYVENELLRVYQEEGGNCSLNDAQSRRVVAQYVYPPTAFSVTAPFAMLPWGPAHLLWMELTIGSIIFASFLIWNIGADYAPIVSGALIGFLLANSELLVITGNVAGLAISLCVAAVWCFLRERYIPAGILCLAISLALKPQDAGLVWLYFLLAGGVHRKHAWQTLLATAVVSLPAILWVWLVSPRWMQELHSNILAHYARGTVDDPGLATTGAHGLGMMVNLQTIFSAFRDDPRFYNLVSYLICIPLLLVWAFVTLRSRHTPKRAWLALAAIAALTMLPVYHRTQDTKLLLLAVPACAMLWAEGGRIGRLAMLVTTAGFVLTGDLPWVVILALIGRLHLPATWFFQQVVMAVQVFPVPLILLTMGIFYLWVYVRSCSASAATESCREAELEPGRL